MADTGYWIECIPLQRTVSDARSSPDFYSATIHDFPDLMARGLSPDRAIDKLRRKLEKLHQDSAREALPSPHNRLAPPRRLRDVDGWMSVYLDLRANLAS